MVKSKYYIILVALFTVLLVTFPASAVEAASNALNLCARSLVPSLFPFFVCSSLLINLGVADIFSKFLNPLMRPLFGLSGSCSLAVIIGFISGYPVGAKTAADLYTNGSCLKTEAEKLLAFCNNSGPMFIIGAVGTGMLGDPSAGIMLYISHILSSLIVAFLFRGPKFIKYTQTPPSRHKKPADFGEMLTDCISSSVTLTLNVCGFVIIFGLLFAFIEQLGIISALSSLGIDASLCKSCLYGLIECSGGCQTVISEISSPLARYMLLSAVIAWSGISVHLQVLGIIKKAKLSPKLYFKGKALTAIISPVITMFIYAFNQKNLNYQIVFQAAILISVTLFALIKILTLLKKLYFLYSAQPPR